MARSSRRLGAKMPGVSTKMSCDRPRSDDAEHARARRLHLGRNDRRPCCRPGGSAASICRHWARPAARHSRSASMSALMTSASTPASAAAAAARLGRALRWSRSPSPAAGPRPHGHGEVAAMRRAFGGDGAIDRQRQAARLRPFLQRGLGIARRRARGGEPRLPPALDEARARPAARHRDRARRSRPRRHRPARSGLSRTPAASSPAETMICAPRPIARATSAKVSRRTRSVWRRVSSPSASSGKRRHSSSATIEAQDPVAEEFEPLIAAPRAAAARARRSDGSAPRPAVRGVAN